MNKFEMIKWLQNLKKDIGQTQHQDLWHYAEMLDEVIDAIEVSEDAISKEWVLSRGKYYYNGKGEQEYAIPIEIIRNAPNIIPQTKEGEWIDKGDYAECSLCGAKSGTQFNGVEPVPRKTKFCPDCGAKMKGADDEA